MRPHFHARKCPREIGCELSSASGLINALILGGAILPPLMGSIADAAGYTWAFLVPAFSYAYIFFYAVKGHKLA